MSWLRVTLFCSFAVSIQAVGITPITVLASGASSNIDAAIPTQLPARVEGSVNVEALASAEAAEVAEVAASGAPVFVWRETITRHIPEKNTWEVTIQTQTDYQADIDYEPDDFEAKIKGSADIAPPPATTGASATTTTEIGGVPVISFGGDEYEPEELPGVETGEESTALVISPAASQAAEAAPAPTVTMHPPPPENKQEGKHRHWPGGHRASTVENAARVTEHASPGPEPSAAAGSYIAISRDPTFQLTTPNSRKTSVYDGIRATVSTQHQEVFLGVNDAAGQDIIKASVGTEANPEVKIAGATAPLTIGGAPVTFKGHTFTLAPEGLKVGTQTFSMAAIAPAYPTNYEAVLTIDESTVTFVKDAANPTIMTAGAMTAMLGGPAMVTGRHQILYNTDGALVLDGTMTVEPTALARPGVAAPAGGGFAADAHGKNSGDSSSGGPVWEQGNPDNNGATVVNQGHSSHGSVTGSSPMSSKPGITSANTAGGSMATSASISSSRNTTANATSTTKTTANAANSRRGEAWWTWAAPLAAFFITIFSL